MPQDKLHLKDLYRTPIFGNSRKGFLRLDMNESVDGLPEAFVREVLSGVDGEFLAVYPEVGTLIHKIAGHNNIEPENICVSNGSDGAIKHIFDSYVSPGDKVLFTDPTFAMYPVYCRMYDARPVILPYGEDFSFPLDGFLEVIGPDIRLAIVVNPNNPTGTVIEMPNLKKILVKCAVHDVLLIIDEAYFYYYDKTFIEEIKSYNNLVILRTFSKLCGLACARLGYASACPEIVSNLNKVRPTYDVNGFAIRFAETLLDQPKLIEEAITVVNQGKEFLKNQLDSKQFEYRTGNANFILIRCPGRVQEIIQGLYKKNILVGGDFSQDFLKDYLRVTVGSVERMRVFWDAFLVQWEKNRAP